MLRSISSVVSAACIGIGGLGFGVTLVFFEVSDGSLVGAVAWASPFLLVAIAGWLIAWLIRDPC